MREDIIDLGNVDIYATDPNYATPITQPVETKRNGRTFTDITYSCNLGFFKRMIILIKALVATIFTAFLGLFLEDLRELWSQGFKGKEIVRVLKEKNDMGNTNINICKTPVDNLNQSVINPFKIDFVENGKNRSATTQANEILNYSDEFFTKHNTGKIGITYSANSHQAEELYAGYGSGQFAIFGANQAQVFHILAEEIQTRGWQNRVHILPVPTCEQAGGGDVSTQEDVQKAMENIARHLGAGWFVLGLQNQSSNQSAPFAIGGGIAGVVWNNTPQQKYVHDRMVEMAKGNIPNDLQNAFQSGKK